MLPSPAEPNLSARRWERKDGTFGRFLAAGLMVDSPSGVHPAAGDGAELTSEKGVRISTPVQKSSGGNIVCVLIPAAASCLTASPPKTHFAHKVQDVADALCGVFQYA